MSQLIIFTRSDGLQFALSAFDIRRIDEVKGDGDACDLYHYIADGNENCLQCVSVLGNFKTLVARINNPDDNDWWKQ